jgi:two-component sensor histidine kinase
MSKSKRYLVQSAPVFLLIGFLVLMGIVLMNFWLAERAQYFFSIATAARDTTIAAVELRNEMQIAESSQRGFVITGNEIYLAPYHTAKAQAQRSLTLLEELYSSYPNSGVTTQRLVTIVNSKFDEFDRTIELKRNHQDAEILAVFSTDTGKALTDEANVFIAGVMSQAEARLTAGEVEQRANTVWLRMLSGLGAAIIVAVVGSGTVGLARYASELRRARDEVNTVNSKLEQRVEARTVDLLRARDRAELLLSEVNHRVANSLSLVSSMVNMQSKVVSDRGAKEALAATQERIFAIALVHKRLYVSAEVGLVSLNEYLTGLLEHLGNSLSSQRKGITLLFNIDPIQLPTDATVSIGIVVTELVTNAFKYAYPEGVGEVYVRLRQRAENIAELTVDDRGVGRPETGLTKGTGVGTRIINAMGVSLGAQINYRNLNPGTSAELTFSFSTACLKPTTAAI